MAGNGTTRRRGMGWRPPLTPVTPLTDGVVLLRLPRTDDVEAVYTYGQDADIAESGWLPLPVPYARARAAAVRLIHEAQRGWSGRCGLSMMITLPPAADLCGVGHLVVRAPAVGELAYGVAPQQRKRGLATRAVQLLAAWALRHGGFTRLEICVTVRGAHGRASQRVAEKAGFVYAGLRQAQVPATGAVYEDPLYVLQAPHAPTDAPVRAVRALGNQRGEGR